MLEIKIAETIKEVYVPSGKYPDPYKELASRLFEKPVDQITQGEREYAKRIAMSHRYI